MKRPKPWTREEAIALCQVLWDYLEPKGWHVGLTGSVLTKGSSDKDLDILVYPRSTANADIALLRQSLKEFGMKLVFERDFILKMWRRVGSNDEKFVESYEINGQRVDVFVVQ